MAGTVATVPQMGRAASPPPHTLPWSLRGLAGQVALLNPEIAAAM